MGTCDGDPTGGGGTAIEPGEDGPRGRKEGWQLGVPEGESGGKRVMGGEEEVSGTSAAVEAKISTSPSEPRADCCRSRARRLLPITRAPIATDHVRAVWSRPHTCRSVPRLIPTSSALAPNGATASDFISPRSPPSLPSLAPRRAHLPVSLFLLFLYLYLWHTPLASSSPTSVFSLVFPTSLRFDLASHSPRNLRFDHLPQCVPPPIRVWPEPNKLLDSQLGELQNDNSSDFQLGPSDRIPLAHLGPPTPRELLLMLRWWNHLP